MSFPIEFRVGDTHDLTVPDGTFDLCRTERVLRYPRSPEIALREMARVVRRGGSVLAQDFDSDLTVLDAADPSLARRTAEVLDAAVPNRWIGRQLCGLFDRVGLTDVRVVPHTIVLTGATSGRIRPDQEATVIARRRRTRRARRPWLRAAVLTVEGEHFCAGLDLAEHRSRAPRTCVSPTRARSTGQPHRAGRPAPRHLSRDRPCRRG